MHAESFRSTAERDRNRRRDVVASGAGEPLERSAPRPSLAGPVSTGCFAACSASGTLNATTCLRASRRAYAGAGTDGRSRAGRVPGPSAIPRLVVSNVSAGMSLRAAAGTSPAARVFCRLRASSCYERHSAVCVERRPRCDIRDVDNATLTVVTGYENTGAESRTPLGCAPASERRSFRSSATTLSPVVRTA